MADEMKLQRRNWKSSVTRQRNLISQYMAEEDAGKVKQAAEQLKAAFQNFTAAHEKYHETLKGEDDLDQSEQYFIDVQKDYIQSLLEVKRWLREIDQLNEVKAVKNESDKGQLDQTELVSMLNLPKVEIAKFDGDSLKYHAFISTFDETVDKVNCSDKIKLTRLLQYTSGKAHDAISSCALMPGNAGYARARELLYNRFGNDHMVCERLVRNLLTGKSVKSADDLVKLADELVTSQVTLDQLKRLNEVETQGTIVKIAERLQSYVRNRWKRRAMEIKSANGRYPSFDEFVKFVSKEADEASDPVYGSLGKAACTSDSDASRPKKSSSFTCSSNHGPKKFTYVLCKLDHKLMYCDKFKSMKVSERLDFVKRHKLCEVCLWGNHATNDCRLERLCSVPGCGKRHTKFLHSNQDAQSEGGDSRTPRSNVRLVNANVKTDHAVYMPVVGVKVNNSYETCALLDTGSSHTFCTKALIQSLKLQTAPVTFSLSTLNRSGDVSSSLVNLTVSSLNGAEHLSLSNVYVIDDIPVQTAFPDSVDLPHLKGLQFVAGGQNVDLLIGQDNSEALLPLEVKKGRVGEPFVCRTLFGWTLNGPDRIVRKVKGSVTSHFITSQRVCNVDKLWNIENEGLVTDELSQSINDKKVLKLWNKEKKVVDGHYQLPIPWKEDVTVPSNFVVANSRLKSLKRNLLRKDLFDRYNTEILKLIESGYAELVPPEEIQTPDKCWYLPHHGVVNDKKPEKLRVVFDCASKYCGESLNDKIYQGPDLNNKLLNVLIRFRQHPFCFTADIEAIYHQVLIPIVDRNALRFLWYDSNGRLVHFRMTRHVFGGVWCASSSTFALRQTVLDSPMVDDTISRVVINDFYVDDCLVSSPSIEEAKELAVGVKTLLASGGFKLTKFVSNESDILAAIPEQDTVNQVKKFGPESCSKVLGIQWSTRSDEFSFLVNVVDAVDGVTRRSMLSTVASIYDPLGLVGPMIVLGKILFQEATRNKLDWDDDVPSELKGKWLEWLVGLRNLKDLHVSRCVKPSQFNDAALELHHFCDSSEQAYGCCSYLRCVNKDGDVHCALLMSKGKLAPIKSVTVPRLELQAAVLAAKVDALLREQMSLQLISSVFWTDSELVLKYIVNESRRFQTFVANRVSCIRGLTEPEQWKHISGTENPADLLTRGQSSSSIDLQKWYNGPEFLSTHKCQWNSSELDLTLREHDPGVKRSVQVNASLVGDVPVVTKLSSYYSEWKKLLKGIAWLLRFKDLLRHNAPKSKLPLSSDEISRAEIEVVRNVQSQFYPAEMALLSEGKAIPVSSSVRSLAPFVDDQGLLRVGGRLKEATLDPDAKNPLLVPHKHPVALLIARQFHEVAHLGTEWVVSRIRTRFWIPKVRVLVKSVGRNCIVCKKLFDAPASQLMANLPPERLKPDKPPFSSVGIDCFGPFLVRRGRSDIKRYGCLFTCSAVRAIHLEKLCNLDTDSFLNAFRRFVARRGVPESVWSDNGTNFVGAKAELEKVVSEIDVRRVNEYCISNNIQWNFIPPSAPHMGGLWERMVRTVKKVLLGITGGKVATNMSDEMLDTLLCEAEYIVNSRPLTKSSEDINDAGAITPNHLLILSSRVPSAPGNFDGADLYRRKWRCVQHLANQFWVRWIREYVPTLQGRSKWSKIERDVQVGDLVLIVNENTPRPLWPMALVTEVYPGKDTLVRSAKVRTKSSSFVRPITKLVLLECD